MTKNIKITIIMIITFMALLSCNVFAAETLPEAVDGVITLTEDVELTAMIKVEETVTVNLNGHNITRPNNQVNSAAAFYVNNENVVLTINGEGTVSVYGPAVMVRAGKAILNSGTYESMLGDTIYTIGTGSIEIFDGIYKGNPDGFLVNQYDASRETSSIIIKGGSFLSFDPSNNVSEGAGTNFVAEEYKAVANGDYYEVVCAHKSLVRYPEVEATLVEVGCKEHWECSLCYKLFLDASAETEVTDESTLVIPKLIELKGTEVVVSDVAVLGAIKDSKDSTVVELPVLVEGEIVTTVTVPVSSMEAVVDENKGLLLETSDVTVTLDAKTVAKVVEQAGSATNITIEVKEIDAEALNSDQQAAFKDKSVEVVISAKILANGKIISDFKGGKVTVEIPFEPAEGYDASEYKFVYIDDVGKVTDIPSEYFNGAMVVELEHFSEYAIVRELADADSGSSEAGSSESESSSSDASESTGSSEVVKDNTPKTGALSIIGLVLTMAVGGLVLTRKKK